MIKLFVEINSSLSAYLDRDVVSPTNDAYLLDNSSMRISNTRNIEIQSRTTLLSFTRRNKRVQNIEKKLYSITSFLSYI